MRSKLLTVWAVVLMGAFGAVVHGKVALMVEEREASPFAKLYAQAISSDKAFSDKAMSRQEAKKLYQEGKCIRSEDLYRLASVLAESNDPADLLLAHDCALASLIEGFRPSARALQTSQKQLLRSIGYGEASQVPAQKGPRVTARLLEQFEVSWSAATNSVPQKLTGTVSLAVED